MVSTHAVTILEKEAGSGFQVLEVIVDSFIAAMNV
jgi:hypothetical protein